MKLADQLRALTARPVAHRALIRLVDAGLDGATPFVALVARESLDVVIRQSRAWPLARALPVLREIAAAIDASWKIRVGHGALHPRDIFVGAGIDDLRITGFGISQALEAVGARVPLRRRYPRARTRDWRTLGCPGGRLFARRGRARNPLGSSAGWPG